MMEVDNPCFAPDLAYDVLFIGFIDIAGFKLSFRYFLFHFVSYLLHLIFAPLFFLACHIYLFTFLGKGEGMGYIFF